MNNPCGFASLALSDQKFNKATAWCIEMRQENICTFILDLQLFEIIFNNRSLPLWPTEKAHTAEYRLHTGCSKRQSVPARAPSCPVSLLPAMLHNQLRCIALSKEASSSKHRQSPVSCASMDQSPLGNPNCNLLTHKG